nr:hypothetical protein B0A51_12891 [Rachicladosporium sp. CCFEE 5018]
MPSSLQKVQKHVNKKKGAKASALHEFSRDARRLRRAGNRDEKVSRSNKIQRMSNNQWTERTAFFRDQLPDVLHPFETAEIQRLIEEYLSRHDEELAQLKSERREGRPKSTRHVQLEQAVDVERKEYVSGYWMPDLQDFESLQKMEAWDGEWTGLANLRFARVDSEGRVKASQFPPKGGSLDGRLGSIAAGNAVEYTVFTVHETLLRARSKFFEAALSKSMRSWQENQEGVVRLPGCAPDIVRRYLHYVYSGILHIYEPRDEPEDGPLIKGFTMLARLYVLGDYVPDTTFKVCVLRHHIISMCAVGYDSIGEAIQWFPTEAEVGIIYSGTPAGSPMRILMVATYADRGGTDWLHDDVDMYPKHFLLDHAREHGMLNLKDKFCTIIVGGGGGDASNLEPFTVHEDVICKRSKLFEAALSRSWDENEKHMVKLPERDPDIVRQYLHHAYAGTLYEGTKPWTHSRSMNTDVYPQLTRLYVFGEYVRDKSFKRIVVSAFLDCIRVTHNYTLGCGPRCFSINAVVNIMYGGTTAGSPGRKVMVDMYAAHPDHPKWLADEVSTMDEGFLLDLAAAAPAFADKWMYDEMHMFDVKCLRRVYEESRICKVEIVKPEETSASTETLTIHEDMLRRGSRFFEAALSKSWTENDEGRVKLPDADPSIVRIYLHQLCRGALPKSAMPGSFISTETKHSSRFPGMDIIGQIYQGTPSGSLARQQMVEVYVTTIIPRFPGVLEGDASAFDKDFMLDLLRAVRLAAMSRIKGVGVDDLKKRFTQENIEGVTKLPAFAADLVRRYLHHIYGRELVTSEAAETPDTPKANVEHTLLAQLYVLGELLQDKAFRVCVLDRIIARMCEAEAGIRSCPNPANIAEGSIVWIEDDDTTLPQEFLLDLIRAFYKGEKSPVNKSTCKDMQDLLRTTVNSMGEEKKKQPESAALYNYEGEICKVTVGADADTAVLSAHEEVLRAKSKFFEAALSKQWQEAKKGVIKLPDVTPDTMRRWLHHAYGGHLLTGGGPIPTYNDDDDGKSSKAAVLREEYPLLGRLYVLGQYLQDKSFRICVLHRLIILVCAAGKKWVPGPSTINIVYEGTAAASPARQLLVACWVSQGKSAWLDGDSDRFPKDFLVDLARALYEPNAERLEFIIENAMEIMTLYSAMEQ